MWQWLRELHDVLDEVRERRTRCNTCEALQTEIANLRREKGLLLNKILTPPPEEEYKVAPEPVTMPSSRFKPWRVKQQELEREDAIQAARIRKQFEERTASLEKELGVADAIRRSEEVPGGS